MLVAILANVNILITRRDFDKTFGETAGHLWNSYQEFDCKLTELYWRLDRADVARLDRLVFDIIQKRVSKTMTREFYKAVEYKKADLL